VIAAQVAFQKPTAAGGGLRDRKKVKTRQAIEDAALELFATRGFEATTVDQIADRAEVSTATFFRYFPNKADVILSEQIERLPDLRQAIVDQPRTSPEPEALRRALQEAWVANLDPARTALTTQAIARSRTLRGLGHEIGHTWQVEVSSALAKRRGRRKVDRQCWLAATVALFVFGESVKTWVESGCRGELRRAVDEGFDSIEALANAWATTSTS
jgi:AcrR family transcriptional regulator